MVSSVINNDESQIQITFISWFRLQYPKLSDFIFHIPNGNYRHKVKNDNGDWYCPEGLKLKKLGVLPGVADVFLMIPNKKYNGLWIEFKSAKGIQNLNQKKFEKNSTSVGYNYCIVRSLNDAIKVVKQYLKSDKGCLKVPKL